MAAMGSFAYSWSMWTLLSRQYSSDLRDFFLNILWWIILLKFVIQESAYIQDGCRGPIRIFKIDVRRKRSPVVNIYPIFENFVLNMLW